MIESYFEYDVSVYGETLEELGKSTQFTVPVVVNRGRILRTRAKFDTPWFCSAVIDTDDELVSQDLLAEWLERGGRRIGLGGLAP